MDLVRKINVQSPRHLEIREDTHKKGVFFSGRSTKIRVPPPPLEIIFTFLLLGNGLKWIENADFFWPNLNLINTIVFSKT